MTKEEEVIFINKHQQKILDLIEHADKMTTSDVQGVADAIVMSILQEVKR